MCVALLAPSLCEDQIALRHHNSGRHEVFDQKIMVRTLVTQIYPNSLFSGEINSSTTQGRQKRQTPKAPSFLNFFDDVTTQMLSCF